jgi:DNA-binding transcriptional MerR regulator
MASKTSPAAEARPVDKDDPREFLTVTQLADALGVTPRAIRFYETKGLILPSRLGATRVYTRREMVRMKLILRGKRLGFSLRDIKEFLDLYDADTTKVTQMRRLIENIHRRAADLEEQRAAITETLGELAELEQQALGILNAAGASKDKTRAGDPRAGR